MNRERSNGKIFVYFIKMFIVFLVINVLMMICSNVVATTSLLSKYGNELIIEVFYAISVLIVMLLFDNAYVFSEKKDGFWESICLAVPMLLISFWNFGYSLLNMTSFNLANLINIIFLCMFVGISEEFLCRGWLLNEFLERFSSNKKEILSSLILSSMIFGLMHITNLPSQSLLETILQIINATTLGLLLSSLYYKTKNIWSVIFLHSFYDFSIYLSKINTIKECTYNTPSKGVILVESISTIIISIIWILGSIYILKKCDFKEFSLKKKNNSNTVIYILMGIMFILLFIPYEKLAPDYDKYRVCYSYNEKDMYEEYTLHFPNYKSYTIKSGESSVHKNNLDNLLDNNNFNFEIVLNSNNTVSIKNINTSYEVKLDYRNVVNLMVVERENDYLLLINTNINGSTVYFSNYFKKDNMSNDNTYLDNIKFNKYELPLINRVGYITSLNNTDAYLISTNGDSFVIDDSGLYILK